MPFPWIAAAKAIPWTSVIAAAPGIARGARDLWTRIKQRDEHAPAPESAPHNDSPEARLSALERHLSELTQEAELRSGLLADLAEQNEHLVNALNRHKRLSLVALLLAATALGGLLVHSVAH
jgi:hypothetical protein